MPRQLALLTLLVHAASGCTAIVSLDDLGAGGASAAAGAAKSSSSSTSSTSSTSSASGSSGSGGSAARDHVAVILADAPLGFWRLGERASSTAADAGPLKHDGLYFGAPELGQSGAVAGDADTGVGFDGADDRVDCGEIFDVTALASFTVEAWVRPTVLDNALKRAIMANDWWTPDGREGLLFYLTDAATSVARMHHNQWQTLHGPPISIGTWTHVAVTFDGSELTMFQNGQPVATRISTTPIDSGSPSLTWGAADSGSSNFFEGALDEVAVFDAALSAERVFEHYAAATD